MGRERRERGENTSILAKEKIERRCEAGGREDEAEGQRGRRARSYNCRILQDRLKAAYDSSAHFMQGEKSSELLSSRQDC